ncbi:uncharacterized protein TNCT_487261 [Trichonephila clavata]|uniref:Uncharacterized protein n=1 Tax=Trichonephila clavata TaxID=2740835 RepID=A0A8X6LG80_TRICU|nr:uncharacterized protein TNCT_487261 [Trichonephila clavata]
MDMMRNSFKDVLNVIVEERTTTEKQKATELGDKQKAVAVAQQQEREFELEKLRIQFEMQKLSQAPVTFKKKEFRKPCPIKKSQSVGGYHDNHSPGPSRTVPRFPSSRTEGRNPIQCYGCGTPGVVKSKCPTCTRTNEMETEVNCMTLFNLNSDLYPSSVIVLKIFGEKIAVCADTGASHTIAGEKLFKFLQEHGITFTNKTDTLKKCDGWWTGPHWLHQPEENWPKGEVDGVEEKNLELRRKSEKNPKPVHFSTKRSRARPKKEFLPLLKKAADRSEGTKLGVSRAAVVNISAGNGSITTATFDFPVIHAAVGYRVSKAASNMAMRMIAPALTKSGILDIQMCPGWVKTDMGSPAAELEVSDSIAAMLKTMEKLNESHQGAFIDRNGEPIPF